MKMEEKFLVPDYYKKFVCKGPTCRHSCCEGYRINITMDEYYRLKGLECSEHLRSKLDAALVLYGYPDENRYAHLSHAWDGRCRMHRADGYCALQGECGAQALTSVCRYYPRSPLNAYRPECSCANACEGVIEQLFAHEKTLSFEQMELCFDLAGDRSRKADERAGSIYDAVRHFIILEMQDRRLPVGKRIEQVKESLAKIAIQDMHDEALLKKVEQFCSEKEAEQFAASEQDVLPEESFTISPERLFSLIKELGKLYASIEAYAEKAKQFREEAEHSAKPLTLQLQAAWENVMLAYPDMQLYLEQMMVNHVFYTGFPYADERTRWEENGLVLTVTCELLRVLIATSLDQNAGIPELADLCANYFRMAEFTAFAHNVPVLMGKE